MKKFVAKFLICTLLFTVFLPAQPAQAWNSTGHRVIAAIAWQYLTPEAKTRIIELLKSAPADSDLTDEYDPDAPAPEMYFFMNAAYWPDIVRDRDEAERYEKYHQGNWHYIGTYWKQTPDGPVDAEGQLDEQNIVERIKHFRESLADPAVSDEEKAIQIAWVLHLIGDIHMPLHNTSRVTEETPNGDLGGNAFRFGDEWPWNLHAYWDSILDIHDKVEAGKTLYEHYESQARKITNQYPRSLVSALAEEQNVEVWNEEGQLITRTEVYPEYLKQNEQPPKEYLEKAYSIAKKRMAISGYRMAEYLNQIFAE